MEKNITPKDYNKVKNAIKSTIRQQFSRSDHYKKFLESKRIEWKEKVISEKTFKVSYRKRVSYRCVGCNELISAKSVNVDHITPIGHGVYQNIEDALKLYKLVYCSWDNLQILCKEKCHKRKTKKENENKSFHNAEF